MSKQDQQSDILPDMSDVMATMGRGSMQRRIAVMEQELAISKRHAGRFQEALYEAKESLAGIAADDNTWQGQEAKAALVLIAHMLK